MSTLFIFFSIFLSTPNTYMFLSIIPRLVENVILMSPDSLALKQRREPQAVGYIFLWDHVVSILWLADDEFGDLCLSSQYTCSYTMGRRKGAKGWM
jgi:hypothetical protein